jgi:putative ABC transport system ATP-binding protein
MPNTELSDTPFAGLTVSGLELAYPLGGGGRQVVLDIDRLDVTAGAAIGVTGPSGSGKSSLIHAIAGLIRPARGTIAWAGTTISDLPEVARDRWRRLHVGLIFQDFHLFDGMTALDNVLLPAFFDHFAVPPELTRRAAELLDRIGLADPRRRVERLSRGEMQRVAIARAVLRRPSLLLADEPTASLDASNGSRVIDLLLEFAAEAEATLIVVSHDRALLARLDRAYRLETGRLGAVDPAGLAA